MKYKLKTERLILRPLDISDKETVHKYSSDADTARYMLHLPNETMKETISFLVDATNEWNKAQPDFYEFAVTLDNKQIGAISVYLDKSRQTGEFGWIINKNYRGKGYAFEAAVALLNFARNTLKLEKIIAHCDTRNKPSYSLMEKLGMKRVSEGKRVYSDGENAREYQYEMYPKS